MSAVAKNIDLDAGRARRHSFDQGAPAHKWRAMTRLHPFLMVAAIGLAAQGVWTARADAGGAAAASWQAVATFNGDGASPRDTNPFLVHGRQVRLVFTVKPNGSGPVPLLWQLFRDGTSDVKNELGRNACVACDGPQTNELGTVPAGRYYLHVITSRPWMLTVEEAP
jgi:hypothetical protein